jgi:hypothetical protein
MDAADRPECDHGGMRRAATTARTTDVAGRCGKVLTAASAATKPTAAHVTAAAAEPTAATVSTPATSATPATRKRVSGQSHPGGVAAWPGEAGNETECDRISAGGEDDRNRRSHGFGRERRRRAERRGDHGHRPADQIDERRVLTRAPCGRAYRRRVGPGRPSVGP